MPPAEGKEKTASTKKVFDVAKPGKTAPDASARPIIVTHRPMVQDPMMSDAEKSSKEPEETKTTTPAEATAPPVAPATVSRGGKVVKPLDESPEIQPDDSSVSSKTTAKVDLSTEASAKAEKTSAGSAETDQEKPPSTEEKVEVPKAAATDDSNTTSSDEAVAEESEDKKTKENAEAKEAQEEQERQAAIEKLIEEKKYFVHVGEVHHKRKSRSVIVLLLLLIVIAAGGYLAIDAGFVETNFELPYNFIQN